MIGGSPSQWYSITSDSFLVLWKGFLVFVPKVLGALIVFFLGWLLANGIGRLATELLRRLRFNDIFERTGWKASFQKAEIKVDISEFFGAIAKWILVGVFLLAAVQIMGFLQFAAFLTRVLSFIPNVIVTVLIFVVAVVLSDILEKVVVASVERARIGYARLAGLLVRWAILGFAFLAILVQLGIARELVITLFTGIIGIFVVSFGLAFGLGGRDIAAEILRDLMEKLK